MPQIILPVKYRTTKIYYQEQKSPDIRFDIFNFSSFRVHEQQLHDNHLNADSDYLWILYCYQDPLNNNMYALSQKCKPTVLYKKLPNEWLLKILAAKK